LSRLEEQVTEQYNNAELHRRHRVETRRLSVDTPENRFVKMVLTRCTRNIVTGNLKEPFSWPFEIVSSSSDPFSS
jgi:predicted component of viral defense system (DUF524 family)